MKYEDFQEQKEVLEKQWYQAFRNAGHRNVSFSHTSCEGETIVIVSNLEVEPENVDKLAKVLRLMDSVSNEKLDMLIRLME